MVCNGFSDFYNLCRTEFEEKKMKTHSSKIYILLLLAFMFAAPGITAYIFFQNPSWLGSSKINKGTLISQPQVLSALDGAKKWRIIYWTPNKCASACLKQLDVLARMRLALGRKLYSVDQWLILGSNAPTLSDKLTKLLKDQDFHRVQLTEDEMKKASLPEHAMVYLANPDQYLILSYLAEVNPDDIYKDLKLLLNTAENKSG